MKNTDIVVVGIQPWDLDIGSNCRNIALEFSKQNRVLYVNYALDRITKIKEKNSTVVKERIKVLKGQKPDLEKINDNLWVFTPKVQLESINWIKTEYIFRGLNKLNNKKLAREIDSAIERLDFKNYIIFNDNDIFRSFHLKELLNPEKYVYYIRDYVVAVDYWKTHGEKMEPELIAKADAVCTNSSYLSNYALKYNNNSSSVGQGCDLKLFNHELCIDAPNDMPANGNPIVGYTGALNSLRLEIDIIKYIAIANPSWNVVLVGPEDNTFKNSELHSLPNVYFLGNKDPEILPVYIKSFDVCINPQKRNKVTIGNYPRKIDEYLAIGKPVVATRTEAMDIFESVTYQAETKEEYVTLISTALSNDSKKEKETRIQFASEHTWENNVNKIYDVIENTKPVSLKETKSITSIVKNKLNNYTKIKQILHRLLIPKYQARPRLWVRMFVNPFYHKKGKNSQVRRSSRMDVLPFNKFNLGKASTIEDFTTINNGLGDVIIGDRVRVGLSNTIIGPVTIYNDVILAQNIVISGLNHSYQDISMPIHKQKCSAKNVAIKDEVWIGANSVIVAGVTIGKHSVVAAGSIVTKDVPPYSVVVGNPAKVIKQYNHKNSSWELVAQHKTKTENKNIAA